MSEKRDFYEVLGVDKKATADEIKKAYRKKLYNITPTAIPATKKPRRNLRRRLRHTTC